MGLLELFKDLARGPHFTVASVFEPLSNPFPGICLCGNIEQSLIGFSILHDGRSLSFYGKHQGTLAFPEMRHEGGGTAAESR